MVGDESMQRLISGLVVNDTTLTLQPDSGRSRAYDCLIEAVAKDNRLADYLTPESSEKVEAYFNPKKKEDAYLLFRAKMGLVLAFRGTLTPPISPNRAKQEIHKAPANLPLGIWIGWMTFVMDWLNNAIATDPRTILEGDQIARHKGFDESWQSLRKYLTNCDSPPCSIYRQLLKEIGAQGQPLFVTGHSKGGALATLAGLDLADEVPTDQKVVVYTFAAAKALSKHGAALVADRTKEFWRFEYDGDIVPSLPPDDSYPVRIFLFVKLPSFAHVGNRVFFRTDEHPDFAAQTTDGRDPFDDEQRLLKFYDIQPGPGAEAKLLHSALHMLFEDCSPLRNHFAAFSAVQSIVWKKNGSVSPQNPFFKNGVSDQNGNEVLWGYENWCDLLSSFPWLKLLPQ
jgi:hypothetical protein